MIESETFIVVFDDGNHLKTVALSQAGQCEPADSTKVDEHLLKCERCFDRLSKELADVAVEEFGAVKRQSTSPAEAVT